MNALRFYSTIFSLFCLAVQMFAQTQPVTPEVTIQVQNEMAINTKGLDFSPTFYEDGIVFISTNPAGLKKITDRSLNLPAMSILRSRRNAEGLLSAPEPFAKELSSLYHEGPVCFDRTAETVFFSSNVTVNGKDKIASDGTQKMRIYTAQKTGGTWSEPQPLTFNNGEFDDCHPVISIDGDKLFFASNRPGGIGGMDLYVSYKIGESWSEPVNLGPGVNTTGNEAFPFIHADNTLYFASDGLSDRKGGLDMYYVIPEGSQWTKPVNMGAPFNTGGDDFGLIVDLNKINGYYSTNGAGGAGGDEILNFHTENGNLDDYLLQSGRFPDRKLDLKLVVTDRSNSAPIDEADVQVLNYDANNVIGRDEDGNLITLQNIAGQDVMKAIPPDKGINGATDSKGRFAAELSPGNYVVIVTKKGYQSKQVRLPITKEGNELAVQLEKAGIPPGKVQWNPSVFNYMTNAPLAGAMLVLTNETTGKKDTVIANADGQIEHLLDKNTRYTVDMYQGKRLIGSTDVDTHGEIPNQLLSQNISVAPLLPGSVIELPNIYYNFNDATLRPDARKDLEMVVALMRQQPGISVELASHTDSRGGALFNQELSQRRANGVVEYLVMKGISRNRLQPVGYGESEPRNLCADGVPCTEQQHARNRRTEIKILTGVQGGSMIYVDGQINNNPEPQPATTVKQTNERPVQHSAGVSVTNAAEAAYYVVAGSFTMENRAQTRMEELRSKGFNAEIIRFTGSTFYSVCVGKFDSRRDADVLRRAVEKDKIEAFVRAVN
ncbi:MAG: OmpA family protein [Saprospiraceae bacterium]|nr:OmpA family protein [Saprospiraceae bacterium]